MSDTSLMPFGKYKGRPVQDVPASYLHWIWENWDGRSEDRYGIFAYIRESMDALKEEVPDRIWSRK